MIRKSILIAATALVPFAAATAQPAASVPLIPRDALFGNPVKAAGQHLARRQVAGWIAPRDGVMNIWVAPAADPAEARPLTNETRPADPPVFLGARQQPAALRQRQGRRREFPALRRRRRRAARERIADPVREDPRAGRRRVAARSGTASWSALNNRDAKWHDVHSLDLETGKLTPVLMNMGGYAGFLADQNLDRPRRARRRGPTAAPTIFRVVDNKVEATPFETIGARRQPDHRAGRLHRRRQDALLGRQPRPRHRGADRPGRRHRARKTVIAENARADIGGAMANPRTGEVEAYAVNYLRNEWTPLDPAVGADLAFLKKQLQGRHRRHLAHPGRRQVDGRRRSASSAPADDLALRPQGEEADQTVRQPARRSTGLPLAAMHPVEIKSRDGLTLVVLSDPAAGQRSRRRRPPDARCRWCCWSTAGRGAATPMASTASTSGWPTAAMRCCRPTSAPRPGSARSSSTPATCSGAARCTTT